MSHQHLLQNSYHTSSCSLYVMSHQLCSLYPMLYQCCSLYPMSHQQLYSVFHVTPDTVLCIPCHTSSHSLYPRSHQLCSLYPKPHQCCSLYPMSNQQMFSLPHITPAAVLCTSCYIYQQLLSVPHVTSAASPSLCWTTSCSLSYVGPVAVSLSNLLEIDSLAAVLSSC